MALVALVLFVALGLCVWRALVYPLFAAHGLGTAVVLSAEAQPGRYRVRWQGQSWAALNSDPTIPLALDEEVVVVEHQGTCLQVISKRSPLANN